MNHAFRFHSKKRTVFIMFVAAACLAGFSVVSLFAQNDLQQKLGELKESMAKNKQALAQYTWQETVVVSLKGQQKKNSKIPGPHGLRRQTAEDVLGRRAAGATRLGRARRTFEAARD
jgi:hypothetical protein